MTLGREVRHQIVTLGSIPNTGSNPVVPPITGSRGTVLSRLHRRQEHVGSNPVFPTNVKKCSISIVVIILACHAGDEDSISSCCSQTLPFSIKAIIQDSGSWDTCSIRVTATTHGGHERRCSVSAYGPYARGGPRNRINEMSHGKVYKIPIMRFMESKTGRVR